MDDSDGNGAIPGDGSPGGEDVREPFDELRERLEDLERDVEAVEGDVEAVEDEIDEVEREADAFEEEIEGRTVHRSEIEADLKRYVRRRLRRGHARGWGPYLVLLYGTAMTLGGFYFLSGGWAILAMIVVWLSTLGLYTLMVLVGLAANGLGLPMRAVDFVRDRRR